MGWPAASGVVEGACKHVVGLRFKRRSTRVGPKPERERCCICDWIASTAAGKNVASSSTTPGLSCAQRRGHRNSVAPDSALGLTPKRDGQYTPGWTGGRVCRRRAIQERVTRPAQGGGFSLFRWHQRSHNHLTPPAAPLARSNLVRSIAQRDADRESGTNTVWYQLGACLVCRDPVPKLPVLSLQDARSIPPVSVGDGQIL